MTQLAIDYAWQHPDPAQVRAAGYDAVLRYVSTDPSKDLSPLEASGLHAAGLGIGLIFETTAQRALESSAAGGQDGAVMLARLRSLGAEIGTPALVNVGDWAPGPADLGAIEAYYLAYRGQLAEYQPGAGGYGTGWVIDQLAATWPLDLWWQNAINDQGTPGDQVVAAASIYQRIRPTLAPVGAAGSYDEDAYGFGPYPAPHWWGTLTTAPPPPPPAESWPAMLPQIAQGASGPAVRTAQGLLIARYFHLGTSGTAGDGIDGSFGPLTNAAVRTFQGQHGLTPDGIIGPKTWPALAGVS